MTIAQPAPIWSDVAKPGSYCVKQGGQENFVRIAIPNSSQKGQLTLQTQCYFVAYALTCWTNYDDVGPVVSTANIDATLTRPFVPNNFTLNIQRDNVNNYTNLSIPQADICSDGYRAGKTFPLPIVFGPRTNFLFTFQDTTGLFLLTATSAGSAVPLDIYTFLIGHNVPLINWERYCKIYPQFASVFA